MSKHFKDCLREIRNYKKLLQKEAQDQKTVWENFGQEYVTRIKEKYGNYLSEGFKSTMERDNAFAAIRQFEDWCATYCV